MPLPLFSRVEDYLRSLEDVPISPSRQVLLAPIRDFLVARLLARQTARLVFICTHNSRRSHLAQIWAQVAAHRFAVGPVECFSGGTEVTACNPRTLAALQRTGLSCVPITESPNPVYLVQYAEGVNPLAAFSKVYDRPPNPRSDFAAVMTCAQAEVNCPVVFGAAHRFLLTYDDPKAADDSEGETAVYDASCRQIATEMQHLFSQVALHLQRKGGGLSLAKE